MNILATCTPYQVGNIPVRGEHCAWMESSAVIYANSVLGARTKGEGTASAGAASLTGKIPCWGNHRYENRYGTHLQHLDINTLGIVWARTPANYENISQVLAAMETIAPDGTPSL